MSADNRANYAKTCEGCRNVIAEPWAKGDICFHCGAEGRCKGYIVGIKRFLPYVPAWCPEKENKPCMKN